MMNMLKSTAGLERVLKNRKAVHCLRMGIDQNEQMIKNKRYQNYCSESWCSPES